MLDFSFNNLVHANVFNFLVMVIIIAFIAGKLNLSDKIENLRKNIENKVTSSDDNKNESLNYLKNAEKEVETLGAEVNKIKTDASKSAKAISDNIINQAQEQVKKIEFNASKNILNEENKAKSELVRDVSLSSVKLAKKHVKQVLENNLDLHKKLIYESIDKLDGIEF